MGEVLEIRVPKGISSENELFQFYEQSLKFPYFGHNWDALLDCLRDLEWIPQHRIVVIHDEMPRLNAGDLRIYTEILADWQKGWEKYADEHEILVIFPSL